jgi:methylenetetrahydrofolate dehydrogenase (NADP+)/methenyltetrahydrofolate cyclohydrolase
MQIDHWNHRKDVDGILVQLPLAPSIDPRKIMQAISPEKDVDGSHPENLGKLVMSDPSGFCPCTPLGIQTLLSYYNLSPQGQHVVIVGRSVTVGKPLALLLSQTGSNANATVTLANRSTRDLAAICRSADIIIAAVGSPKLIQHQMVKDGAIVIDVGINRQEGSKKLIGDVDFEEVEKKASWITPVPGGVGPMTIASLLANTVKSYSRTLK